MQPHQRRERGRNERPEVPLRSMRDLWTALALVLVIEGALYALFPEGMKRAAARALLIPPQAMRLAGLAAACVGVVLVWLVRR
jgi:uncharacterized protein YjeT (DUF2065 family)